MVIDTSLNTQKIESDFKTLEKKTQSLINKYNRSVDSIKSQELAAGKLKSKIDEISSSNKTPTSLKSIEKQIKIDEEGAKKLKEQIDSLNTKQDVRKTKINKNNALLNDDIDSDVKRKITAENFSLSGEYQNQEQELDKLRQRYDEIIAKIGDSKNKLEEEKNALKSMTLEKLNSQLEISTSKLEQSKTEANQTKKEIEELLNQKANVINPTLDSLKDKVEDVGEDINKFGKRISKLLSVTFIFNVLRSGFSSLKNNIASLLKTNDQFNSNLNQIRANMMTAFAPIYNAILPALNTLMNTLSRVTGTIATFISTLFGMKLSDSTKQAKALSGALKDVSKNGDKADGSLSQIDKLDVIGQNDSSSSGGNDSSWGNIDYSGDVKISSKLLTLLEKMKKSLDVISFDNLNDSLGKFKGKLDEFGNIVGGGLWWLWENLLVPLGKWTIEDVLPSFLDILSNALTILNQVCKDLQPIWEWFWERFLKPIAEWTGDLFVGILKDIGNALEWISQNEDAMLVLEILVATIVLINGALAIYNGIMVITNAVTGVFAGIMAVLTSPITLVILAITALIAIIALCVKHWDDIVAATKAIYNFLKDKFIAIWNKLKDTISSVMSSIKNIITSIWNAIWNVIKGIINKIITGVENMCNAVIKGLNKILEPLTKVGNKILEAVGIKSFSFSTIPTVKLPRLAEGTVIPPRHEFAAILGDQKHGTNIEAPLETIKQANREVLTEFFDKIGSLSSKVQEIVLKNLTFVIQLGGKDFRKAVFEAIRLTEKETGTRLFVN